MARRPVWLAGIAADALGFAAQAVALTVGRLSAVQPALVVGLVFALPLFGARMTGQVVRRADVAAAVAVTAALAAFLVVAAPSGGRDDTSPEAWLAAGIPRRIASRRSCSPHGAPVPRAAPRSSAPRRASSSRSPPRLTKAAGDQLATARSRAGRLAPVRPRRRGLRVDDPQPVVAADGPSGPRRRDRTALDPLVSMLLGARSSARRCTRHGGDRRAARRACTGIAILARPRGPPTGRVSARPPLPRSRARSRMPTACFGRARTASSSVHSHRIRAVPRRGVRKCSSAVLRTGRAWAREAAAMLKTTLLRTRSSRHLPTALLAAGAVAVSAGTAAGALAAVPASVVPAPAAAGTCPATFLVLHDDHIGQLAIPKGAYTITTQGITCTRAVNRLAAFLQDFDGRLPGTWAVDPGTTTFVRGATGAGFTIAPAPQPTPAPAAPGTAPEGRQCPGTFQVDHDDRIGALRLPAGPYRMTIAASGRPGCATAHGCWRASSTGPTGGSPAPGR